MDSEKNVKILKMENNIENWIKDGGGGGSDLEDKDIPKEVYLLHYCLNILFSFIYIKNKEEKQKQTLIGLKILKSKSYSVNYKWVYKSAFVSSKSNKVVDKKMLT